MAMLHNTVIYTRGFCLWDKDRKTRSLFFNFSFYPCFVFVEVGGGGLSGDWGWAEYGLTLTKEEEN